MHCSISECELVFAPLFPSHVLYNSIKLIRVPRVVFCREMNFVPWLVTTLYLSGLKGHHSNKFQRTRLSWAIAFYEKNNISILHVNASSFHSLDVLVPTKDAPRNHCYDVVKLLRKVCLDSGFDYHGQGFWANKMLNLALKQRIQYVKVRHHKKCIEISINIIVRTKIRGYVTKLFQTLIGARAVWFSIITF